MRRRRTLYCTRALENLYYGNQSIYIRPRDHRDYDLRASTGSPNVEACALRREEKAPTSSFCDNKTSTPILKGLLPTVLYLNLGTTCLFSTAKPHIPIQNLFTLFCIAVNTMPSSSFDTLPPSVAQKDEIHAAKSADTQRPTKPFGDLGRKRTSADEAVMGQYKKRRMW